MANPTTNYGWPMPTSTDLVTDLPADFALFGQPVDTTLKALNPETTLGDIAYRSSTSNTNTRLGIGTAGQVLAVSGGVPAWTTTADVTPLTTKGDLFTFTTVDARIGIGANNTVLTADSAEATGMKWATPSGGGKILQVVFASNITDTTMSTTTFTDTGLTATITPTSNTSRIAIFATNQGDIERVGSTPLGGMRLLRDATALMQTAIDGFYALDGVFGKFSMVQNYVDSPATTSATTYKTQGCGTASAVRLRFGYDGSMDTIILMEIGA